MRRRRWLQIALDVLIAAAAGAFDLFVYLDRDGTGLRTGGFPTGVGVALIIVGALALLVRRRHPLITFLVTWCVSFSSVVSPDLQPIAVLLVALYTVAAAAAQYVAVLALVASFGAMGVIAVNTAPVGTTSWAAWLFGTLVADVLLPSMIWAFGRFRHRAREREERLRVQHQQSVQQAVRDERKRLGRDLHDIVSHTVSVMTLQAAGARAIMDRQPDRVGPALEVIERAGVQAMNELQRLLTVLRADGAEQQPPPGQPQLSDLEDLIDLARSSGQQVELAVSGRESTLDPSVELACYRVVQEALTNARKHAGPTARVDIRLEWVPPTLVLTVLNEPGDGGAGPALSTGNGLAGLAERIQLVGGRLTAEPMPHGGFRVTAVLPVNPDETVESDHEVAGPADAER